VTSIDNYSISSGIIPATRRSTELIAVSGGGIYAGSRDTGLSLMGASAVKTTGRVDSQAALQRMYFCDGLSTGYKVYDPVADTVSTWATTEGKGTLPAGGGSDATSYVVDNITAAAAGSATIVLAAAEGDKTADFADGDVIEVRGTSLNENNRSYTVASDAWDSTNTIITVDERIASVSTGGTTRVVDEACNMIALYRGRIVMAGLSTDPQNWYMSAVDDPLDWDYFPTTVSATQAVAGNATNAGLIGDVITCLAPYNDDLLVIGGDHTLWVIRGDPAASGSIDNISFQTGIAGPDAYAYDPNGVMYFFGANTLWRMDANLTPEPVSRNRLDSTFADFDLAVYAIKLIWDTTLHGVHIFLTPNTQPSTAPIHYFYSVRTNGFWPEQYPAAMGPSAVHIFDADDPNDKALLMGGWDSKLRFIDTSATADDGTAISSYIMYPPISAGGPMRNTRINEILAVVDANSDAVVLSAYAEDTAQGAVNASTARFVRTLTTGAAGPRTRIIQRIAGNAIVLKLSNSVLNKTWAIENLMAMIEVTGQTRKKQL